MTQSPLATARQLLFLLRKIHISPGYFLVPVLLSIGAATFEGMGMGLLIPMLSGFLQKDFSFLTQLPIVSIIIGWLPAVVSRSDRLLFGTLLGFFIVVIVLKNILRYSASVAMSYLGTRTVHHLRKQIFNAYLGFGKLFFDTTNIGHHSTVLSQFTTESLQPLLNVDRFIHALFSLIAYIVVMTVISWKLTFVAIPLFIILHWSVRGMIRKIVALSRQSVDRTTELGKKVIEILSTMPLVKAFNMEEEERDLYTKISDERSRLEYRTNVLRQLIGPFQELITLVAVLLLLSGMLYLLIH
ncbi:MAG: ABC transporter transmembrane domain-containing protein, partial [Patescibacteria group bacterium]